MISNLSPSFRFGLYGLTLGLCVLSQAATAELLSSKSLRSPAPYPRLLKIWNDTFTPGQVYQKLKPVTTSQWQKWYIRTHQKIKHHQTGIEFLDREMFFVRTAGSLTLINTSQMSEGILLISRKPFAFNRTENLDQIAHRLERFGLDNKYRPTTHLQFLIQIFIELQPSYAQNSPPFIRIAPLLAIIDVERSRSHCLDIIESKPVTPSPGQQRGLASVNDQLSSQCSTPSSGSIYARPPEKPAGYR